MLCGVGRELNFTWCQFWGRELSSQSSGLWPCLPSRIPWGGFKNSQVQAVFFTNFFRIFRGSTQACIFLKPPQVIHLGQPRLTTIELKEYIPVQTIYVARLIKQPCIPGNNNNYDLKFLLYACYRHVLLTFTALRIGVFIHILQQVNRKLQITQ